MNKQGYNKQTQMKCATLSKVFIDPIEQELHEL